MSELHVDFSHRSTNALADLIDLIRKAGYGVRILMAMPSDKATWDGGTYAEAIKQETPSDMPENLVAWLVVLDATITLSHDLGIGHFRANDDPKVIFELKSFLDIRGFRYVIAHSEGFGTFSDNSSVTEYYHTA